MLNVITLFSGYDSQCLALNRLGVDYDLAAWCEIDKHAIVAHNALFPQWAERNLGDVSKVDWQAFKAEHPEPIDLLTYSSPCQDFSSAGLQRGGEEGSGTRSGLLWEVEKAIAALRPRYLVFENVAALVSDKFIGVFNKWQSRLNGYGYTNFQKLMNAKDMGVPQNRLRIFMVSILDCPRAYYFPRPFTLTRRLKDVLEQNVADRYYLKDEQVQKLVKSIDGDNDEARCIQVGQLYDKEDNPQNGRIYNPDGLCPSIMANKQGGQREPKIAEPQMLGWTRNEKGEITDRHPVSVANCVTAAKRDNTQNYVMEPTIYGLPHGHYEGDLYTEYAPTVKSSAYAANNPLIVPQATKDMVIGSMQKNAYVGSVDGVSPCVNAACGMGGGQRPMVTEQGIRIRRLTERELYRLMDVDEADIDTLLAAPIPRTQHAKLAGNSIVVACLYYIFRNLFVNTEPEAGTQTKLF